MMHLFILFWSRSYDLGAKQIEKNKTRKTKREKENKKKKTREPRNKDGTAKHGWRVATITNGGLIRVGIYKYTPKTL